MENQGSHYDRLLSQLNEDMGLEPRDMEQEIRMAFENTDDGRSLDINEWDVVFEDDGWKIVADIGSQWSVTETENAEAPFQFSLIDESRVNESEIGDLYQQVRDKYGRGDDREYGVDAVAFFMYGNKDDDNIFVGDNAERQSVVGKGKGSDLQYFASELLLDHENEIIQSIKDGDFEWLDETIYGPIVDKIQSLNGANESKLEEEDKEEESEEDDGSMSEEEWDEKLNQARAQRRGEDMEGEKTTDDFLVGGKADDAKDGEFDPGQLRKGQHVELEHTDNPAVALEIAKDHLREDPLYYDKLERMEQGECDHPEDDEKYARMGKKNPHTS